MTVPAVVRYAGYLVAALVAVLCLVVLGFLFSPAAVQWVTRSRDELS